MGLCDSSETIDSFITVFGYRGSGKGTLISKYTVNGEKYFKNIALRLHQNFYPLYVPVAVNGFL